MRRAAALGLGLLAVALAALWAGPRLLDWDTHRAQLAAIASARLGRAVTLDGPITLALLPQPRIETGRVTIGPEEDGLALDARAMRLRLDLGALVRGRLEPREIAILRADIRLPWPPGELPSFRPPSWLTVLDARLEDSRLTIGGVEIEGLNASLVTGGIAESLVAGGSFAWRGQAVRFSAQLGRAGFDGIAPLDLTMATAGATLAAQGVLQPGGGFEGRMEAVGPDLGAWLPAPNQPFRAVGRLTAAADLLAADDLAIELGGQAARGAVTVRLAPAPRVDLTLAAGRLDLEAWLAAARAALPRGVAGAEARTLPVGVDLAAEATSLGGVPLRRLRGALLLDGDRVTVSDVSALLPGDTAVHLEGGSGAARRLELRVRFETEALREALGAFGMPLAETDPGRLRRAQGQFRLAIQDGPGFAISDLLATVDGALLRGDAVLRPAAAAPRLSLGLGLTFDRLDMDGLLPPPWLWTGLGGVASGTGMDLNLRLAAESVAWGGLAARRAAMDATFENGRLTLRRLGFSLGELDVALTGTAALPSPGAGSARVSDLLLEIGGTAAGLGALLPPGWPALPAEELPVALRLVGGGPAEAVALRLEGDLGELRVEAQGTLDALARRGAGNLTLRHPGAPRLLAPLLGRGADVWLGQGSFALIAGISASPEGIAAEHLDLVAGALRTRGRGLALAFAGAAPPGAPEVSRRPRLTGRLLAERLPLPGRATLDNAWGEPIGFDRLALIDAELVLEAKRVEIEGAPAAEQVGATLRLARGTLRLEASRARLGGGALTGSLVLEAPPDGTVPRLSLAAEATDVALSMPLLGGMPVDLGPARLRAFGLRLRAAGHSPAALAATLGGEAHMDATEGRLRGLDLAAIIAAGRLPGLAEAEMALRQHLADPGGETPFARLEIRARIEEGRAILARATLAAAEGAVGSAVGSVDLLRGTLDLVLSAQVQEGAPPVDLRLTGRAAQPRRLPEPAAFLRWKAEHG